MSKETVRDEVLQTLRRNFLGPIGGADETVSTAEGETPVSRYMTGILFPSESTIPVSEDDGGLEAESKESAEGDEARLSMCNAPNPSSYGLSFACRPGVSSLQVKVECGLYSLEKDVTGRSVRWMRKPFHSTKEVPVAACRKVEKYKLVQGLELRVTFRPPDQDGHLPITATLINTHPIQNVPWPEISSRCFFQCEVTVMAGAGVETAPFAERRSRDTRHLDLELRHALLLHRHARFYAVGHGCAAEWSPRTNEATAPTSVFITFIPQHDVYPLVAPGDLQVPALPIVRLANDDVKLVTARLTSLVEGYEEWIQGRVAEVEATPEEFREIADEQLAACRQSARRIRKGIAALATPMVFRAFQLSQRAMLEVFARSEWQKKRNFDPANPPTHGEEHKWRPFQVAFLLQSLESVANPKSEDRDMCDLLWFPTGGGKTEAYLALTAFVFFLRRLRALKEKSGDGGGTAVLMRYTLRLLTADQFVRACLLTCAAESIRRREKDVATAAPILIGLWVGDATSPNSLKAAGEALATLHAGKRLKSDQSSPAKLNHCPWCGTKMGPPDYRMAPGNTAVIARCPRAACEFHAGIPAAVVDEQIYDERPSLIVGTVDKFARLPWVAESGSIFSTDGLHPKPELVIQDELHLISGPLGTLSGLYEAAIDHLCTSEGVPPKLIASTATIRNAESQVRQLFNRRFAQFPQPLLDARDSFFARQNTEVPARRFVGLFTPGKTPLTAFIRMAGCLSHAPFASAAPDSDKDPYWSLIAYFNSLRELGGAIVRVHDDVAEYLKTCANLDGTAPAFRTLDAVEELTSRAGELKLDEVRERLSEEKGKADPYDMVLCSNMISVGLDVPRLGLMSVIGQPKTTAEYIQATSRIGRVYPGLIVTLYNWTRSRDRSHYERFVPYHSRLYAEVEATSVTPWSTRARDRALHAVFVILARHLVSGLLDNAQAGAFSSGNADVMEIVAALKKRITAVVEDAADRAAAHAHLDRIVSMWQALATASGGNLPYKGDPDRALLVPFDDHLPHNRGFATMNNMRNVDAPVGLYLV